MGDPDSFITSVCCKGYQLRSKPSKHFTYEIHVKWSSGQSAVIYRRYSQFFNLQCKLLDTFPLEAGTYDPSKRVIPFLPGKKLTNNFSEKTAEKRRGKFDVYLKALIQLTNVGNSALVNSFLQSKESDLTSLLDRKNSQSSQSSVPVAPPQGNVISGPLSLPQYMVLEDYKKVQKGELSVTAGSVVVVIEKKHTGWWLAQSQDDDSQGWVPATFLEPVYGAESSDDDEFATLPSEPERFISTSDYDGVGSDELSVRRGCVVEVLKKNMDGWWLCRYEGKQGMFPSAYLKKANTLKARELMAISKQQSVKAKPAKMGVVSRKLSKYAPPRRDDTKAKPPRPPAPSVRRRSSLVYMAIADFPKTTDDGIALREGMSVKVHTKDDSGWWFVEAEGQKGWAPSTYIEETTTVTTIPASPIKPVSKSASEPVVKKPGPPARPGRPPSVKNSPVSSRKYPTQTDNDARLSTNPQRPSIGLKPVSKEPVKPIKPVFSHSRQNGTSSAGANHSIVSNGASQSAQTKPKPFKPPPPTKPAALNNNVTAEQSNDDPQQLSVAELRRRLAANLKS